MEPDVVAAKRGGDHRLVFPRQGEHLQVEVHADYAALRSGDLRCDEANLAGAAAQVQHRIARTDVARGVATAVVLLEDLQRNRSEEHTSELQSLAYLVCRLL